jgi:long-chain fatty acid transport protein
MNNQALTLDFTCKYTNILITLSQLKHWRNILKKVLVLLVMLFIVSASFATNGDNMVGVTPASRGMAGLGIGMRVGPTDAIFRNPAWMSCEKGFNLTFGGIVFMPKVYGRVMTPTGDSGYVKSDADFFTIPEVAIVNQLNDRVSIGIGAFGVSGMGVDYRNMDARLSQMHTNLQFMRVIPAVSFKMDNKWKIGVGLDLCWGSLDLGTTSPNSTGGSVNTSGGQQQDYGVGEQIGFSFKEKDNPWSFGVVYQSSVPMTYKCVFNSNPTVDTSYEDLKLEQPMEYGLGFGKQLNKKLKLGFDYRFINWSNADGYKQFKWKDQNVYVLGFEYKADKKMTWRAGYNYAKSPIRNKSSLSPTNSNTIPNFTTKYPDFSVEWFNLIGFPAVVEKHASIGFTYYADEHFSIDFSYTHAFKETVNASASAGNMLASGSNEQNVFGLGLGWHF